MEYDVQVVHTAAQDLAVSRFEATGSELPARLGEAFAAVAADLGRRGLPITGPAVACYDGDGDRFSVAAGFEVAAPVAADGVVEPMRLPPDDVVTTLHVGPYDRLPEAYAALRDHAESLGRRLDERRMWEEYLDGPDVPPERNRTVIYVPVRAA
jgi:effector-binding domain-containing protein